MSENDGMNMGGSMGSAPAPKQDNTRKILIGCGIAAAACVVISACAFFILPAIMGPAIGNVFSDIIGDLETGGGGSSSCASSFPASSSDLDQAEYTATQFMCAAQAHDYLTMYSWLTVDVQLELGADPNNLQGYVPPAVGIASWQFNEIDYIITTAGEDGIGVFGYITQSDGVLVDLEIVIQEELGSYKVAGFTFEPR